MLNSEDIGQNPNLTSSSFRAFLLYLRHGLRKPNAAGVWGVGHGAQNSLLAIAHRILTAATPFCSLFPPLAALANVPASLSAPPALVATFLVPRPRNRFAMRQLAGVVDETSRNLP